MYPVRQPWAVHLAASEFLPALIAYPHGRSVFVVARDRRPIPFRAPRKGTFLPAAVAGFYTRTAAAVSFHHIEDVIRTHRLRVSIIAFINHVSDDRVAHLADAVLGTRLSCVSAPGLWAGIRVIGGESPMACIVLFFKGDQLHQQDQMSAVIRGATVVNICTQTLMNTFNFYVEWVRTQPSKRTETFLADSKLKAELVICLFMPKGRHGFNTEAVKTQQKKLNIPAAISQVPYREDWSAPRLDDVINEYDEEDSGSPATDFLRQWYNVLAGTAMEDCRPPYETEVGIQCLKEIVATYVTLREFSNLPAQSVLRYCKLSPQ
jgi:hypothetical protein